MNKFFKDITTGNDNQTHDVMATSIMVIIGILPIVMLWGITMETIAFFTNKKFDMAGCFSAVMEFCVGAGTFLTGGGMSMFFKNKNTPDGTQTSIESIQTETHTTNAGK